MSDPAENLRARLRDDLRAAMKARNAVATSVLRSLIAAIDNAQSVEVAKAPSAPVADSEWVAGASSFGAADVPRRLLSAAELDALMCDEAEKLRAAAAEMARLGRHEAADRARAEAEIAQRYGGRAQP